jgi:replicative DNA helicase
MKNDNDEIYLSAPDVEQVVLGSLLLSNNSIHEVGGDLTVDLFNEEKHKIIAQSIIDLFISNKDIDILTVTHDLNSKKFLSKAGGAAYISQLTNNVSSTAHLETHMRILQQYYLSRYINNTCNESKYKLFNKEHDIFDVYHELQVNLENALKDVIKHEIQDVGKIHTVTVREKLKISESGAQSGVTTGYTNLDNTTNGWQKSDLIILAGRSGMGKTALAVCLTLNPALKNDTPVAIFSLEMSKSQLVGRMQSILSGFNVSQIIKNQLTPDEWIEVANRCKAIEKAPVYIDDTPNITLSELKIKARKLVKDKAVELIIIDYLQLMRSGMNVRNREQEVAEISKGLKVLAKELDIPVIALSQLSRAVEQRGGDKKPLLSDLRESGQIEQDADMVLFCYRPEYYGVTEYSVGMNSFDVNGLFMLIVAKHRNGELGEIPLTFIHEQTKVVNYGSNALNQSNTYSLEKNRETFDTNTNVLSLDDDKQDLPF